MTIRHRAFEFRAQTLHAMPFSAVRDRGDSTAYFNLDVPSRRLREDDADMHRITLVARPGHDAGLMYWSHVDDRAQHACRYFVGAQHQLAPSIVTKYCQLTHNASALRRRARMSDPRRQSVHVAGERRIRVGGAAHTAVGTTDARVLRCGLCV